MTNDIGLARARISAALSELPAIYDIQFSLAGGAQEEIDKYLQRLEILLTQAATALKEIDKG